MEKARAMDISILNDLPPEWSEDLLPKINSELKSSSYKIVILDDDPTGTQTVNDLPVLTHWSVEGLRDELVREYPAFFILTNSRSLPREAASALAKEIGENLKAASKQSGVRTVLISRSDSTLRGHFPSEVDKMAQVMGKENLPYLLLPFFLEGGRYTLEDTHYVKEGTQLVPAADTVFAKDSAFGFTNSNLKDYVEEKTAGKLKRGEVTSISLVDLRAGGPERVAEILYNVPTGTACIVNCVSYRDMEVFVTGLLAVEKSGKEFLYRSAASFVRTRMGLSHKTGILTKEEIVTDSRHGGLFVIGSYVEKTSQQVQYLLEHSDIVPIEIDVEKLLATKTCAQEIARVTQEVDSTLQSGKDSAVYTSRNLITGPDAKSSLEIGQTVSNSVIEIIQTMNSKPRYLVAKGGITSSDVATKGLGVKRAMVAGQALPGVPVWHLGNETKHPGMGYVIFPGNVGEVDALLEIKNNLQG